MKTNKTKLAEQTVGLSLAGKPDNILFKDDYFKAPLGRWTFGAKLTLTCKRVEFFKDNVFHIVVQGSSEDMKKFLVAGYMDQYKFISKYFKMYFPETESISEYNGKLEYRYESAKYVDTEHNELSLRFQAHICPVKPDWQHRR